MAWARGSRHVLRLFGSHRPMRWLRYASRQTGLGVVAAAVSIVVEFVDHHPDPVVVARPLEDAAALVGSRDLPRGCQT